MATAVEGKRNHDRAVKSIVQSIEKCIAELDRIHAPSDIAAHLETALLRLKQITDKQ